MRTVTVPLQVLQLLEPRVLGAFALDYIGALPYEASQRAQVLLADLLTDRGPMLPPGVTPLEQLLGLANVESSPVAAEPQKAAREAKRPARARDTEVWLQDVADEAVEKAKSKRPSSRAVASAGDAETEPKATRTRTSTAEVNSKLRQASALGHKTVADIAKNTGLGRTTVAAALKRLGGDASTLTEEGSRQLWSGTAEGDEELDASGDVDATEAPSAKPRRLR